MATTLRLTYGNSVLDINKSLFFDPTGKISLVQGLDGSANVTIGYRYGQHMLHYERGKTASDVKDGIITLKLFENELSFLGIPERFCDKKVMEVDYHSKDDTFKTYPLTECDESALHDALREFCKKLVNNTAFTVVVKLSRPLPYFKGFEFNSSDSLHWLDMFMPVSLYEKGESASAEHGKIYRLPSGLVRVFHIKDSYRVNSTISKYRFYDYMDSVDDDDFVMQVLDFDPILLQECNVEDERLTNEGFRQLFKKLQELQAERWADLAPEMLYRDGYVQYPTEEDFDLFDILNDRFMVKVSDFFIQKVSKNSPESEGHKTEYAYRYGDYTIRFIQTIENISIKDFGSLRPENAAKECDDFIERSLPRASLLKRIYYISKNEVE